MRELTKQFVLAADEVWRLQGGRDPAVYRARGGADAECLVFQEMAGKGHYGPGAGSKQGIYVCTPDARLLASINSSRAHEVAATLTKGLTRWRRLSDEERAKPPKDTKPDHRFEWSWPKGGLGLTVTMRYLPADDKPTSAKLREYNHDSLWFSAAEARQFLPANPAPGTKHSLPDPLFQRIARFNLVDAVRGETRQFSRVEGAIQIEVTAVEGDVVTIRLTGKTKGTGNPRRRGLYMALGIEAQLLGTARFDRKSNRFVAFEIVGKGIRWVSPRTDRRGRRRKQEPVKPIGWFFTLTPERTDGFYVAPTHIRSYRVEWAR